MRIMENDTIIELKPVRRFGDHIPSPFRHQAMIIIVA